MCDFDLYVFPLHRQVRKEKVLKSLLWKIDFAEIKFGRSDLEYFGTPMDDDPPLCVRHKLHCRCHHELKYVTKDVFRYVEQRKIISCISIFPLHLLTRENKPRLMNVKSLCSCQSGRVVIFQRCAILSLALHSIKLKLLVLSFIRMVIVRANSCWDRLQMWIRLVNPLVLGLSR